MPDDSKFCISCGSQIESVSSIKKNGKKKRKKAIAVFWVLFSLVAVAALGVVGYEVYRSRNEQMAEERLLADDKAENAEKKSDKVLETETEQVEFYLAKATAYVEQWDLYHARETLKKGFEVTGDFSLKNVSIWGPTSVVETAYWMQEGIPITRCEYLFSDEAIYSYIYIGGIPIAGASYICEEECVRYVSLIEYEDGFYFPQQIPEMLMGNVIARFDFNYDEQGRISEVFCEDTQLVMLDYWNGYATAILYCYTDFWNTDQILFQYGGQRRLEKIDVGERTAEFRYAEDGSFEVNLPAEDTVFKFDSCGLLIQMSEPEGDDNFCLNAQNGRVISFETASREVNYKYKDGRFSSIEIHVTEPMEIDSSIQYSYEKINGVERLVLAEYQVSGSEKSREDTIQFSYDESGKLTKIRDEILREESYFTYSDGILDSYVQKDLMTGEQQEYIVQYDSVGRMLGYQMKDDSEKILEIALEALKQKWQKLYKREGRTDDYLEIYHTRLIGITPDKEDAYFKKNDRAMEIDYIVEFALYSNFYGSAPYYIDAHAYDFVIVYQDGTAEVVTDPIRQYSGRTYSWDYSGFVDFVEDFGTSYNQILTLK